VAVRLQRSAHSRSPCAALPRRWAAVRPTLEEFLLFLDRENLFDNWKAGWKPKLLDSLEAWERRQARATARQFPEEAIGALETLGYSVTAPSA